MRAPYNSFIGIISFYFYLLHGICAIAIAIAIAFDADTQMPRWQIENILNIEFAPPSPPLALSVALFSDLITRQRTRRCIQLEVDAAAFIIKHFNLRNTGANMDHARSNKLANKVNKAEAKHVNP